MIKTLHIIQQVSYEGPSVIRNWAISNGFRLTFSECWADPVFPAPDAADGLIVLGGPMNVGEWDKYPWLLEELACIKVFLEQGKPILGVCLGGQMLAHALGGQVSKMSHPEIGVWPVTALADAQLLGFAKKGEKFHTAQWHSYQFNLPENALPLLSSPACQNQAFIFQENVIGMQCHLEADAPGLRRLCIRDGATLDNSETYVQSVEQMEGQLSKVTESHPVLEKMLHHLFL